MPRRWERNFCDRYGPKDHPEAIFAFFFEGERKWDRAIAQSSKVFRSGPRVTGHLFR